MKWIGLFYWIDDISDLNLDLKNKVWSNVLLEIYQITHKYFQTLNGTIPLLAWSMSNDGIQSHLSRIGKEKFTRLDTYIQDLPISRKDSIRQAIADKINIFLKPDQNNLSYINELNLQI